MTSFSRPDPFGAESAQYSGTPLTTPGQIPGAEPESTLVLMGTALLELVRSAAVERGIALPSRQSVYMAPIPADCEQVAVLLTGWTPQPAPEGGTLVCRTFRWAANVSVILTRCTPAMINSKNPKAVIPMEKMTEAARIASDDAEVLLATVNRLNEIGAELSIVVNPPSGGFQTVELNVQLLSTGSF